MKYEIYYECILFSLSLSKLNKIYRYCLQSTTMVLFLYTLFDYFRAKTRGFHNFSKVFIIKIRDKLAIQADVP